MDWYEQLKADEAKMNKTFFLIIGLIVVLLIIFTVSAVLYTHWLLTLPCDRYANSTLQNIPARCLPYYQGK